MSQYNFSLLILNITLIFEFTYQYLLNRNVIFDFNKYIKSSYKKNIQLISIIILTIHTTLYLNHFEMSYFEYLPFFFLLISFLNESSKVIIQSGIRAKKVYKNIITWGQIQSYKITNNIEEQHCHLEIVYQVRTSTNIENIDISFDPIHKYELEETFNTMKYLFKIKDDLPVKYYSIIRGSLIGIIFAAYLILLFTGNELFI